MRDPLVWQSLASAFGVMLVASGVTKLRHIGEFREVVTGYSRPGWRFPGALAGWVAPTELLLAMALLSLDRPLGLLGLLGTLAFVAGATGLIAARWMAGERRFRCGCGTDLREEQDASGLLVRNLLLIAGLSLTLLLSLAAAPDPHVGRSVIPTYLTGVGLAVLGALAVRGLRAWRAIRQWKGLGSSPI